MVHCFKLGHLTSKFFPAGKMRSLHVGVAGATKYGVFDENAS